METIDSIYNECLINTNLKLDFSVDQEPNILKEIFVSRSYADYFPFYQKSIIVDIGAHYGYFSLFATINSHKESSIFSLEPAKNNYNTLTKNILINGIKNIQILNVGIDAVAGQQSFYLSKSKNHSIFSKERYELSSSERVEINVISLKDIFEKFKLKHVDFLKIDCEGAEYPALYNADKNIFDLIKTISMEFHDLKDIRYTGLSMISFLKKQGYDIVKFIHEPTRKNLNYGK